ncbi:MAG: hypothetical protein QF815_02765, partial [Candidatus Peribacteraceae bacterium]|nr:hypothetical protein [Candidatus Peribacteraceae bacterium]
MQPVLLIGFVIIACVSPLLTFTTLWQVKEWRIDRLREHLRSEGIFRQLFGLSRPAIVLAGFAGGYITLYALDGALILLAGASAAQILTRKQ